jgi:hypothetical protein
MTKPFAHDLFRLPHLVGKLTAGIKPIHPILVKVTVPNQGNRDNRDNRSNYQNNRGGGNADNDDNNDDDSDANSDGMKSGLNSSRITGGRGASPKGRGTSPKGKNKSNVSRGTTSNNGADRRSKSPTASTRIGAGSDSNSNK